MQEFDIFISLVPALGAVALSLYNWYRLRAAADIRPERIINYGLWATGSKEIKYKILLIPVLLNNNAIKPGLVTDLNIAFTGKQGKKSLEIRRRVELALPSISALRGMNPNTFRDDAMKELNPIYPVTVRGQEGTLVVFDCFDREDVIVLDEQMTCTITVSYGSKKNSSLSFPFTMSSQNFDDARDIIKWYRP